MASPNVMRPISSSIGYPRTRMRFGAIDVSAVGQDVRVVVASLLGAIEAISKISEPGQDELLSVQGPIDRGCENRNIRERRLEGRDSFGGGDEAEQADVLSARSPDETGRGDGAAAGREHRVDE